MASEVSLSFLTRTRKGRGSLQVMIAGSGRRPSMLMLGGSLGVVIVVVDCLRKISAFSGFWMCGENRCCLLAYDSRRFGGGRGGSMGRNLKSAVYIVDVSHFGTALCLPVYPDDLGDQSLTARKFSL